MQEEFEDPQVQGQGQGNTMAKRKRTIIDIQNTTQKTIISPTVTDFFTGNKNKIFIFWT
jgi:hypothetical protein